MLVRAWLSMIFLQLALPAIGATWNVEQDGTGDFVSIQDAVDAASPGDTIMIGPGLYDDYHWTPVNDFYAVIYLTKSNLTIIGAGAEHTTVGGSEIGRSSTIIGLSSCDSITVSDMSLKGGYDCIYYGGSTLVVERCELSHAVGGLTLFSCGDSIVRDCHFHDLQGQGGGIVSFGSGAQNFLVENCLFERLNTGVIFIKTRETNVVNCVMNDVSCCVQYENYATGNVVNLQASGIDGTAFGAAIALYAASRMVLTNSVIDWSNTNTRAVGITGTATLSGQGNVIRGGAGGWTTFEVTGLQPFEAFTGNDLYPTALYTIDAKYTINNPYLPPEHFDLTGNYWGTDDPDQIAEWINDYHDQPDDRSYQIIVDYIPFEAESTPVAQKSLSGVKRLFR